jgi:YHS domain-containing protein
MFRAIIYALLGLLAFSFVRSVLAIITKGVAEAVRQGAAAGTTQPRQPATQGGDFGGDLVKDPVCGTFVSAQSPYSRSAAGKTHRFCSQACLDRFAA